MSSDLSVDKSLIQTYMHPQSKDRKRGKNEKKVEDVVWLAKYLRHNQTIKAWQPARGVRMAATVLV